MLPENGLKQYKEILHQWPSRFLGKELEQRCCCRGSRSEDGGWQEQGSLGNTSSSVGGTWKILETPNIFSLLLLIFPFPCFLSHLPTPPQETTRRATAPLPGQRLAGGGRGVSVVAQPTAPCRRQMAQKACEMQDCGPLRGKKETFFSSRWRVSYSRTQVQEGKDQVVSQSPLAFDWKQRGELFLWLRSVRLG